MTRSEYSHASQDQMDQVLHALRRIQYVAGQSLSALTLSAEDDAPAVPSLSCDPVETARRMLRFRRRRDAAFASAGHHKGLFGEPVWDMLLDLYVAWAAEQRISVSSLCIAAAVPQTTALRHINLMLDAGLVARQNDLEDARRVYIVLTEPALDFLSAVLSSGDV